MVTEKAADWPAFLVRLAGWVRITGATRTSVTVIFIFAVSLQYPSVTLT